MRSAIRTALHGLGVSLLVSCSDAWSELRLATTPAIQASGLLGRVLPAFSAETGLGVDVLTASSAQALSWAARGDVDLVLIDSLTDEQAFSARGHNRRPVPLLTLRYLLLGPAGDPAGIKGKTAVAALGRIAAGRHAFVSQSIRSGVDRRERDLWVKAGIRPQGTWYHEAGVGPAAALRVAAESQAYVLVEATLANRRGPSALVPLIEADPDLVATVSLVPVIEPANRPGVTALMAYLQTPRVALGMARSGLEYWQPVPGSDALPD